jgi:starch synthase
MRIVMLASEARPFASTGGLGDALAGLPRALAAEGVAVTVCLPGHRSALRAARGLSAVGRVQAPLGSRTEPAEIVEARGGVVPTVFVRADRWFDREAVYGYPDDAERWVVFARAALEWLRSSAVPPDVLHLHDWPASIAAAFLRQGAALYPELAGSRILLTIHNLAHQGRFPAGIWPSLNLDPRLFAPDGLEFHGDVSFLKAGILFADRLTTVSPRYAREILTAEFGEGLDGLLRSRPRPPLGILNGIDHALWNPATDPYLPARFNPIDLEGKTRCKWILQRELGLSARREPALVAMVTRLVPQKGIDLVAPALGSLLAEGAIQLVVLGSGDPEWEDALRRLAAEHRTGVAVRIGYHEGLAHRIQAASDLLLMPSRFEPCGLAQLYALRYGTVPVVRAVGGLDDTVVEFDPETRTGTGFTFVQHDAAALTAAVRRALTVRRDPALWRALRLNAMTQDHSWARAARDYAHEYYQLTPAAA